MITLEIYSILTILYLVGLQSSSHTSIRRCPEIEELEKYSRGKCKDLTEYHCLAVDGIEFNTYREECRTSDWVSSGNYPVFRGRYIDYETCPADSYQPVLFKSNERYKCTYLKSTCSLEGLVEVKEGTKASDKSCRCDYNRGYAFVIRPKNQCACVPSEEDCSCYIKRCANENQQLNPDYQCTSRTLLETSSCQVLKVPATTDTSFDVPINETGPNDVVSPKGIRERKTICLVVLVLGGVMVIVFSLMYLKAYWSSENKGTHHLNQKDHRLLKSKENAGNHRFEKEKSLLTSRENEDNHPLDEKENMNLTSIENAANHRLERENSLLTRGENADKYCFKETENMLSTSKENSENHSFMKKENLIVTSKGNAENSHIMVKDNRSLAFEDNADIVILHLLEQDQKQEVESFKADLENLLIEIGKDGIRIKLLEEMLSKEQCNSNVEFQTVLKKCNFVFVYISSNFLTSKLKRLGLKELSLKDALGSPELRAQIKIASNCKFWQLPDDEWHLKIEQHDVDFDYLKFVGGSPDYKKVFKDEFEKCLTKDSSF